MSIKTTRYLGREDAIILLVAELAYGLPNDVLAALLDTVADSDSGSTVTRFDNFIVEESPHSKSNLFCPENGGK